MQNCDYDFSLLLQMALNKANPDEIVGRDIRTANVLSEQLARCQCEHM